MSELAATPGVIPYVDFHDGPRRILTVISEGSRLITSTSRPVVLVDGRSTTACGAR